MLNKNGRHLLRSQYGSISSAKVAINGHRQNRGFTLIEIIITLALTVIVMGTAFSLLMFGQKVFAFSTKEFDLQAAVRLTEQKAGDTIRYATALFTIPKSRFSASNLDTGWSYLGVQEVILTPADGAQPAVMGTQVVLYTPAGATHHEQILMPAQPDVTYELKLVRKADVHENTLLEYTLSGYKKNEVDASGNPIEVFSITTELEGMNTLQIIEQATGMDPAVGIGFRTDERPKTVVGQVAMVMDNSGSMAWGMNGSNPPQGNSRISILKSEATALIQALAAEENINVSLVPFATSANSVKSFKNARNQTDALLDDISKMNAVGGTNTGDGLRRAYWQLKNGEASKPTGVRVSNHVIILVDGVTTYASYISNADRRFVDVDGNINEGNQVFGLGNSLDSNGTLYVNDMGRLLRSDGFSKAYVIGFSSRPADLNSVQDIADACGAPASRVFRADSSESLSIIFDSIRQEIINDIWYLQGPSR